MKNKIFYYKFKLSIYEYGDLNINGFIENSSNNKLLKVTKNEK